MQIYSYRLNDYLKFIFEAKLFLNQFKIKKIICLNESGETENILLKIIKPEVDTILLQHSFLRYNSNLNNLQWRYEDQNMIGLKCKKMFLWGKSDLEFFSDKLTNKNNQLFISGSPRHDNFSALNYYEEKYSLKTILITLSPISERSGLGDTDLMKKYNEFLMRIFTLLKKLENVKIIVKLHPGENPHNSVLQKFLNNISGITIFQIKDSKELIKMSDIIINFSPELYDSSTIMLEGLLFQKPIIQLALDNELQRIKPLNSAIIQLSNLDNFEEIIKKNLYDENYRGETTSHIPEMLNKYLGYQNEASKRILKLIESNNNFDT